MPDERSFFAERYYREHLQSLRCPDSAVAPWVADALELLVDHVDAFPPPDDEDSFVVEYIYPH